MASCSHFLRWSIGHGVSSGGSLLSRPWMNGFLWGGLLHHSPSPCRYRRCYRPCRPLRQLRVFGRHLRRSLLTWGQRDDWCRRQNTQLGWQSVEKPGEPCSSALGLHRASPWRLRERYCPEACCLDSHRRRACTAARARMNRLVPPSLAGDW